MLRVWLSSTATLDERRRWAQDAAAPEDALDEDDGPAPELEADPAAPDLPDSVFPESDLPESDLPESVLEESDLAAGFAEELRLSVL